jgi:hypothetical protein
MFSSNSSQVSSAVNNYIENVFSTYLYTGTGASLTITNNIDTSTYGGLTWIKSRSAATDHKLTDTARGVTKALISDTTGAQTTDTTGLTAFGTTGFTIGADANYNTSAATYASWTFRKQPKFFDIVTYTGTGSATTVPHSLGSVPGSIWVKRTDTTADWAVYHTSLANTEYLVLNTAAAKATGATWWNSTTPTSAVFSVGTNASVNASGGGTYVAYIFAHNAGGFGLTGADNVISCGSYSTDGSGNATVNLGYEPQWVLRKASSAASNWDLTDTMRGMLAEGNSQYLRPNTSGAEGGASAPQINATGFSVTGQAAGTTYIYIAIRRGPMKVPTLGTSVYNAIARTGTGASAAVTGVGFSPDLAFIFARDGTRNPSWQDKLRGTNQEIISATAAAELAISESVMSFNMNGVTLGLDNYNGNVNSVSKNYINWLFGRAPSFFDEVCYTGTGSNTTFTHNLGAVPELIIVKRRSAVSDWAVYSSALGNNKYLSLNDTIASSTTTAYWNSTTPTSSVFTVGTGNQTNGSGSTYVAYLFATCTGVSKVGSYTGTGATQTIACGFGASGARFVLIKRTDSTGDWYVWDSARGMISGTDPSLLINSTAAEVNANSIYAISTGFQIVSTAAGINSSASGANYIFLAIA